MSNETKNQGEPVVWRCEARNGGTGRYSRTADTEEEMRSFVAHYEGIGAIIQVTPLYTHADPAEVERLRKELLRWKGIAETLQVDAEKLSDDGVEFMTRAKRAEADLDQLHAERRRMDEALVACANERDSLRAQLAERDALLRDFIKMAREPESGMRSDCLRIDAIRAEQLMAGVEPEDITVCGEFKSAINHQSNFKLSSDTIAAANWGWSSGRAALSASAEPSLPKCECDMRTKLVGDGCAVCNTERAAGLAEPSAPAECDERAAFEASISYEPLRRRTKNGNYAYASVESRWEGWQARAALERKP